ncbi:EfeM/EfeO family lipoprotein [Tsukamurella ocularis]|uniref:EfeM/EfeO family lipoprotein n=1 Tax=Tsukamurella ocularis TaxID=1970234 RepID=UPI0021679586|nr:EfeM/EfeO family lipoprotein [Tsukamurella ocularis]MCS3781718.1 iron uptake system component EfeO [Tsukamurella ocularis]MCS3788212.1 iron uptake system component EfeO [Tsukamurella ocularis]MCS3851932.1 iron uptake system component EfeO [Tsukamurella ocularis]
MPTPGRWVAPTAFTLAAVVAAAGGTYLLTAPGAPGEAAAPRGTIAVPARLDGCVAPAGTVDPGNRTFAVTNTSTRSLELALAGPDGAVYAELDALAPRATRLLRVALGSGDYHFECYFAETDAVTGTAFRVPGDVPRGPAVIPTSTQDLTPATLDYQAWVGGRLPALRDAVATLAAAHGIDAQRAAWRTAHRLYETLGAAYDAFGEWDGKINGRRISGDASGFHAIEAALWAPSATVPAALEQGLVRDVDNLLADYPSLAVNPLQIGLRAHEITENTIEFTLTGVDDAGSHTGLDIARANLEGTRRVLDSLGAVLSTRYARLPETRAALDRADAVSADLAAVFPDRPLAEIPLADRQRLNTAFGGLVELLAPIAAIADVRRTK